MKTMTCRQLGGPCDLAHQPARDDMKSRWRHPRKSLGW